VSTPQPAEVAELAHWADIARPDGGRGRLGARHLGADRGVGGPTGLSPTGRRAASRGRTAGSPPRAGWG